MVYNARRKIAIAMMAVMAIANAMAPRLSHASPHEHAAPTRISQAPADFHRHMSSDDKIVVIGSGEEQSPSYPPSWPDHNCCSAICAPMAHIFNDFSIGIMRISDRWVARPLTRVLHSISPPTIERPPRLA